MPSIETKQNMAIAAAPAAWPRQFRMKCFPQLKNRLIRFSSTDRRSQPDPAAKSPSSLRQYRLSRHQIDISTSASSAIDLICKLDANQFSVSNKTPNHCANFKFDILPISEQWSWIFHLIYKVELGIVKGMLTPRIDGADTNWRDIRRKLFC